MVAKYRRRWRRLAVVIVLFSLPLSCNTPIGIGYAPPPTAPATLPEIIANLSSYSAEERIVAARALSNFGEEAIAALPALVQNLYYEYTSDVRRSAAIALGQLGPDAREAVPDLITVIQTDNAINVRKDAARALGRIGEPSAVPALASNLYHENEWFTMACAESIAAITGENFPGVKEGGYELDDEGTPLIVIAARNWWAEEGQFKDW